MSSQHLSSKKEVKTYGYTGVEEQTFRFKWIIQDFEYCLSKGPLKSPDYFDKRKSKLSWYLQLHEYESDIDTEGRVINLDLFLKDVRDESVNAKLKVSILNNNGKETNIICDKSQVHLILFGIKIMRWDYGEFFKEENGNLSDGTLTLFCEITYVDIVEKCDQFLVKVPECCLRKDLENVFEIKKFCDITLLVGGQEFQAHKNILSGRSNVFAAIFDNDFAKNKKNCFTITDIDPEVFEEILRFMYTGRTKKIKSMANELLIAADKYALERLKVLCEEVLSHKISIDNVCDFLVLADKHSADQLKVQTMEFIKNNFTNVRGTVGWKNAKDSDPLVLMAIFERSFEEMSLG